MEVDNDFLIKMDAESMIMCMDKKYGGTEKKLSDISFLEFRKHLYKKYYVEDLEHIVKMLADYFKLEHTGI